MDEPYKDREQSAAKHQILRTYLQRLAYKVAQAPRRAMTINYVDAFAGPWESQLESLDDTSPAIALRTLLDVRASLLRTGVRIEVRAFFVSKTQEGVDQLQRLAQRFPTAMVEIAKGTFEEALPAAVRFAQGGVEPFTFIFIDPTGWTGFSMRKIVPLLQVRPGEVLINFMLEFIRRFAHIEDASSSASIADLFGDLDCREEWRDAAGEERDDQLVAAYCRRVASAGAYEHCVSTPIFKRDEDREHFRLVYATRSHMGLLTFREVEARGLLKQKEVRTVLKQEKRQHRSGQGEMFSADVMSPKVTHEDRTRRRHLERALAALESLLSERGDVSWDTLLLTALQFPLVNEADAKAWLEGQRRDGFVEVLGLEGRETKPKLGKGHRVRRRHVR